MKAIPIKKQLHEAIDLIEDDMFLKAINTILQQKSGEYHFELNEEEKSELARRKKQHLSGKSKNTTFEEIKKHAVSRIKK